MEMIFDLLPRVGVTSQVWGRSSVLEVNASFHHCIVLHWDVYQYRHYRMEWGTFIDFIILDFQKDFRRWIATLGSNRTGRWTLNEEDLSRTRSITRQLIWTNREVFNRYPELNFCEKRDIQVKTFTDFPSVSDFFSAHFSSSAYLLFALIFFFFFISSPNHKFLTSQVSQKHYQHRTNDC